MAHHGEILQESIKNSGFSISKLVQELGITRPTIYRKFKDETLDSDFVSRISSIIGRNITLETNDVTNEPLHSSTPALTNSSKAQQIGVTDYAKELISLQQKYIKLLEDYNALLMKVYGSR